MLINRACWVKMGSREPAGRFVFGVFFDVSLTKMWISQGERFRNSLVLRV